MPSTSHRAVPHARTKTTGITTILDPAEPVTDSSEGQPGREDREVERITRRLTRMFPALPVADVRGVVAQAQGQLDGAPVRTFVPLLVEKTAKDACRQHLRRP